MHVVVFSDESSYYNIRTVKPVFKTIWEIGATWELRTATSVPSSIHHTEMDLRNKTTSEFRTVLESPLGVPNSQFPLYMVAYCDFLQVSIWRPEYGDPMKISASLKPRGNTIFILGPKFHLPVPNLIYKIFPRVYMCKIVVSKYTYGKFFYKLVTPNKTLCACTLKPSCFTSGHKWK